MVPAALRAAGLTVHVMADVYGERIAQGLADETWLADVGDRGWAVLMKDARIRYRPTELGALQRHGVRAFCLTNANLRGVEQADRLIAHLDEIVDLAALPGPGIYGVSKTEVRHLWPRG